MLVNIESKYNCNKIYYNTLISEGRKMIKKTRTMVATVKEGKKFTQKPKAARTSTIQQTIAAKDAGFKKLKKSRKTKTIAETIKEGTAQKTKKVVKKTPAVKKAKAAKKAAK